MDGKLQGLRCSGDPKAGLVDSQYRHASRARLNNSVFNGNHNLHFAK